MAEVSGITAGSSAVAGGENVGGDAAVVNGGGHIVPKGTSTSWLRRCFTLKPLEVVHAEEDEGVLERTLGFWDLFALGFGGTVGRSVWSGVYWLIWDELVCCATPVLLRVLVLCYIILTVLVLLFFLLSCTTTVVVLVVFAKYLGLIASRLLSP